MWNRNVELWMNTWSSSLCRVHVNKYGCLTHHPPPPASSRATNYRCYAALRKNIPYCDPSFMEHLQCKIRTQRWKFLDALFLPSTAHQMMIQCPELTTFFSYFTSWRSCKIWKWFRKIPVSADQSTSPPESIAGMIHIFHKDLHSHLIGNTSTWWTTVLGAASLLPVNWHFAG